MSVVSTVSSRLFRTTDVPPASSFTFMAWVWLLNLTNHKTIFHFGPGPRYAMEVDTTGQIELANSVSGAVGSRLLSAGRWYHLAYTCEGTGTGQVKAYIDGILDAAGNGNASITNTQFQVCESGVTPNYRIAALKIWDRALTAAEVRRERLQIAPVDSHRLNSFFPFRSLGAYLVNQGPRGRDLTSAGTWTSEGDPPIPWRLQPFDALGDVLAAAGGIGAGTIASSSQLHAPSVTPVVTGGSIAAASALHAPSVTPVVTSGSIASAAALHAPAVTPVVVTGTVASSSTLHAPAVTPVVTTGTVASGAQLHPPSVAEDGGVTGGTIASGSTLHAPSVTPVVTTGTIAAGSALHAPAVTPVVVTGTVASSSTLHAPAVVPVVTTGTIAGGAQLHPPTVADVGTIVGGTIAAASLVHAPTVTPVVAGGTVAVGSQLFPPTLAPVIAGGHLSSSALLFAPLVTPTVGGGTIVSGSALYPPTVFNTSGPQLGHVRQATATPINQVTYSATSLVMTYSAERVS